MPDKLIGKYKNGSHAPDTLMSLCAAYTIIANDRRILCGIHFNFVMEAFAADAMLKGKQLCHLASVTAALLESGDVMIAT